MVAVLNQAETKAEVRSCIMEEFADAQINMRARRILEEASVVVQEEYLYSALFEETALEFNGKSMIHYGSQSDGNCDQVCRFLCCMMVWEPA